MGIRLSTFQAWLRKHQTEGAAGLHPISETRTETMEDKVKRMLREEVRQMMAQE
ncbi:MAG: hypothetical protein HFF52_08330 [Lawsonibacter sp.]|nr:hypothetical protein [Lawsonibacter sp.]